MNGGFLAWADRRHFVSVRAGTLYVTLWLTWLALEWSFSFANGKQPTVDIAAIIGAVTAPVCALQGFVFKWYMENKA